MEAISVIDVDRSLTADNDVVADQNRRRMEQAGATCINVMSSPGSGKTTLLEATLVALGSQMKIGIIEGDMTTELDADRLRACGAQVAAITTGRSCHLECHQIAAGLDLLETNGSLGTRTRTDKRTEISRAPRAKPRLWSADVDICPSDLRSRLDVE